MLDIFSNNLRRTNPLNLIFTTKYNSPVNQLAVWNKKLKILWLVKSHLAYHQNEISLSLNSAVSQFLFFHTFYIISYDCIPKILLLLEF